MLPVDFKMISAAALKACIYLTGFVYAKFSKTPPWATQHIVYFSFFPITPCLWISTYSFLLQLLSSSVRSSLSLMGSYWAGTADALVVVVMCVDWWRLQKWEARHFYPIHSLKPSCQDSDVHIQLQTRCIFIRIFISTHFSSLNSFTCTG